MAGAIPASRVEVFEVTAPAGTLPAVPVEVATGFTPGELVGLEIVIPDGHDGLTGIRLALAHAQAIPHTAGAWIIGNDETIEMDTAGYPNSGAWSAIVYNADAFDHTFHLRFYVADFALLGARLLSSPQTTPVLG